jgi:predicted transcriptional regulator
MMNFSEKIEKIEIKIRQLAMLLEKVQDENTRLNKALHEHQAALSTEREKSAALQTKFDRLNSLLQQDDEPQ